MGNRKDITSFILPCLVAHACFSKQFQLTMSKEEVCAAGSGLERRAYTNGQAAAFVVGQHKARIAATVVHIEALYRCADLLAVSVVVFADSYICHNKCMKVDIFLLILCTYVSKNY